MIRRVLWKKYANFAFVVGCCGPKSIMVFLGKTNVNILISEVKAICHGLHPNLFSKRALEHYSVMVSLRWTGVVPA